MAEAKMQPHLRVSVIPTGGCGGTDGLIVWDEAEETLSSPKSRLDRSALLEHLSATAADYVKNNRDAINPRLTMSMDHASMAKALAGLGVTGPDTSPRVSPPSQRTHRRTRTFAHVLG